MKEILVAGVVLLAIIGVVIIRLLGRISSLLEEISENLPDKHFSSDPKRGMAAGESFWRETQLTMNRIARIYEKFVLGEDYLSESQKIREKWEQQRECSDTQEPKDRNEP